MGERRTRIIGPPHGIAEIVAAFGDILTYVSFKADGAPILDMDFEKRFIRTLILPFPIRQAGNETLMVERIRCHALLQERFMVVFNDILSSDLAGSIQACGGCYSFRFKRRRKELSTHSWGIAIDINPETNMPGTAGDMDPSLVAIFKKHCFVWGGDWRGRKRDPMHFQYCTGY
jgi:hypothetical protein